MQQRNNQLAVCAGTLMAFICALFVKWYTITNRRASDYSRWPDLEITGIHGSITLFLDLPVWLLLMASIFFTLLLASNIVGWTSIPWPVILAGLVLPGLYYTAPLFGADGQVQAAVGPVLAVIATVAAFFTLVGRVGAQRPLVVRGAPTTNL